MHGVRIIEKTWPADAVRRSHSLPKRQHLLLVGRVAVRLNEIARPAGQLLPIVPRHVLHLGCDDPRHVSDPTFLHIERQDPNRSSVLPSQEIADDGRSVCLGWVGLNIGLTRTTEIAKDEMQVLFWREGCRAHGRGTFRVRKSGSVCSQPRRPVNIRASAAKQPDSERFRSVPRTCWPR